MNIKGPIEVTDSSHPFSSMKFSRKVIDIDEYGFVEEEYIISGLANVYTTIGREYNVQVMEENLPYTTRLLVRRPMNNNDFSGICYIDIMNASNGYDIEDLWRRSYLHIMEQNHMYIGITTKPINVLALKNFDYDRYKELNWSNLKPVNMPQAINPKTMSIDGTEEGLVWDIINQVGIEAKQNQSGFTAGLNVKYCYLTGQSQSGMYLNTYVNYMHNYYKEHGVNPYDGYLSLASGGLTRALRQEEDEQMPMAVRPPYHAKVDAPFISMNTENDYFLFGSMGYKVESSGNYDQKDNKRRYYDMAAAPHTDAASPLVPTNEEIVKTKCPPRILDNEYEYILNDLPFDYYINGMLVKLHEWVTTGVPAPIIEPLTLDEDGAIVRDELGHALGGIRSPFIEVPRAIYKASYDEKSSTNGTMKFFTEEEIIDKYGSKEEYFNKFKTYVDRQVETGLLTRNDATRCLQWAQNKNRGE